MTGRDCIQNNELNIDVNMWKAEFKIWISIQYKPHCQFFLICITSQVSCCSGASHWSPSHSLDSKGCYLNSVWPVKGLAKGAMIGYVVTGIIRLVFTTDLILFRPWSLRQPERGLVLSNKKTRIKMSAAACKHCGVIHISRKDPIYSRPYYFDSGQ